MNNEQLILNELKDIKQGQEKIEQEIGGLKQGQEKIEQEIGGLKQGQVKLEQGQARIINDLVDFREEVKQDQVYTHARINEGFEKIAEQMVHLFAHEKRITELEHGMAKMSVLVPMHFEMRTRKKRKQICKSIN